MDKNLPHQLWVKFRAIKPWYFLILFLIVLGVAIYALRQNNLEMAKLHDAVYTADKNNGNVQGALEKLQAYVINHMNTDLSGGPNSPYPPIQLEYTYERLQESANQAAGTVNQSLYTDAENYCQQQIPNGFSGRYRVGCIEQYITSHGAKVLPVPASLYEFNFLSPTWSPDLAGWSLVVAALCLLLFVISAAASFWRKHLASK